MLCHPAVRRRRPAVVALVLSLALSGPALGPLPVAAQAPGLQLAVERPDPGSAARGTVVIGGWAVDTASPSGTGVPADGVEIWLGPAGTGQRIDAAGYGDPRRDVAARFGNDRFLPSGFRYFWNACDAPPGPQTVTVTARGAAGRTASTSVPVMVGSCQTDAGETVEGQIFSGGQVDAWTFQGTAGERVAITLDGVGGWDTLLEVMAPNGTREDVDDDGGPDLNSWLTRHLSQTGTYTVLARPLSSEGCTGDYVLLGWLGEPGRSDPNRASGAQGTAASLAFRSSIREFGERQQWAFPAEAGNELIVYLPRNVGSRLDPFIELVGPDGQLLARDDDSGGGLNSFLQGVLPQSGTYSITVQSVREDCGGEYVLRIDHDWGSDSRLRGTLAYGDPAPGALNLGVRRDVWTFAATAGERVTLTLDPSGPARLQVAGPDGNWEQSRGSRGRALGLSFVPAQTGPYNAVVFMDTSRGIDYDLTLERGFGRLVTEHGPVALGQRVPGEIHFAEGRDLYSFEGRQGQQVRIALERPGRSQLDPYLELLDPDGRTLAEDDDSGGELNSLIQVPLPRTGRYTVVARGLADSAGPYVLVVTLEGEGVAPTPSPTPGPRGPTPTPTPAPGGPPPAPSPTPARGPGR